MHNSKQLLGQHYYFLIPFGYLVVSSLLNINFDGQGDWNDFAEIATIGRYYFLEFFQLPLWDPYSQGGVDMTQQPEAWYFSPFFILILIFGVPAGLKITMLVYVLIGYIGTTKWLKTFEFKQNITSLCAALYAFSTFFAAHLGEGHFVFLSMFYLPWILYVFRLKDRFKIFSYNYLLLILLFTSGSPNFIIYSALIYLILISEDWLKHKKLSQAPTIIASALLAVLSTLFILLPIIVSMDDIDRGLMLEDNTFASILKSLFYPLDRELRIGIWGAHEYQSTVPYILWPLWLISIKQIVKMIKENHLGYFVIIIAGLLLSLGGDNHFSLYYWLKQLPIISDIRVASRFLILFVLMIPFLTAISLRKIEGMKGTFKIGSFKISLTFLVWFLCLPFMLHNIYYLDSRWISGKDIRAFNDLGEGEYNSFHYEFLPDILEKEKMLKPNVGFVNTLRSQTELKRRTFSSKNFLLTEEAKLKSWTPNHFTIEFYSLNEIPINMYCNHFWQAEVGELKCEADKLLYKPSIPQGEVKIFYDDSIYMSFIYISLLFFLLTLFLINKLSKKKPLTTY